MSLPDKNIWIEFLAILAGVFAGLVIMIPAALFSALLTFSDGPLPKSHEIFSTFILISGVLAGAILAGYITTSISRTKTWISVFLTGLFINLVYLIILDFDFSMLTLLEILVMPFIVLLNLAGWFLYKIKNKNPDRKPV